MKSSLPNISDANLIKEFIELDGEIGFVNLLRALNTTDQEISKKKNIILIFSGDGSLEIEAFRDATDALRALFRLETESPGKDMVLVKADTSEEIRIAFKNYFSDAREFIALIEEGCEKLGGKKVVRTVRSKRLKGSAVAQKG